MPQVCDRIPEATAEYVKALGKARFWSKRSQGFSATRKDGSVCREDNDIEATLAEFATCRHLGLPFDEGIYRGGDGGQDAVLSLTIEILWLGRHPDGSVRYNGNAIMNPEEPQRWADIYVVVGGGDTEGWTIMGWTTHNVMVQQELRDFGNGPRWGVPCDRLYDISSLTALKRQG